MATRKAAVKVIALDDVKVGDTLNVEAIVTNTGSNELKGGKATSEKVTFSEGTGYTQSGKSATIESIPAGESVTLKGTYETVDGDKTDGVVLTVKFQCGSIDIEGSTEKITVSEAV